MSNETLMGSCLCGAVTYRVRAPFKQFAHCHCERCRKATGTGHATNLYVEPGNFAWLTGEDRTRYDLPTAKSFATTFCRTCGSPLPHHTRSGRTVVVPAGSLGRCAVHEAPSAHFLGIAGRVGPFFRRRADICDVSGRVEVVPANALAMLAARGVDVIMRRENQACGPDRSG